MEHQNTGQKYSKDFKQTVVELYQTGTPVRELSSEYGVSDVTIYKWIKAYTPTENAEGESVTPDEISDMQKEIQQLKQERDILKKAMAIFAKK